MAVFDEAAAERVLKRMRVEQLRNELESRGEDASGTADRLRTLSAAGAAFAGCSLLCSSCP